MRGLQSRARLHRDPHSHRYGNAPFGSRCLHELIERHAVNPLHDQEQDAVLLAQVENLDDMRMSNLRSERGLVQKHLLELLVFAQLRQHRFDGDDFLKTARALEAGRPYHCHSAGSDRQ